jgi:biopolymer transport protein ExbD
VVIQADEFAPTGLLVKVMDQVRMAGVLDISIAASTDG